MSMAGYTKLFNSILASTIWRADDKTRIVWITLLAMADKNGVCEGSVPGLADFAHVSLEDCIVALENLTSPDEWSRSKEHEGRRVEAIEGGWRLINHGKYRQQLSADERREYLRVKQAEQRAKRKQSSTTVNSVSDKSTQSTQAAPAPAPKASPDPEATPRKKEQIAVISDDAFDRFWARYPKRVGKDDARRAWQKRKPSIEVVLKALDDQRDWLERDGGQYTPNPSTWINQGRWQDSPPSIQTAISDTSQKNLLARQRTMDRLAARKA